MAGREDGWVPTGAYARRSRAGRFYFGAARRRRHAPAAEAAGVRPRNPAPARRATLPKDPSDDGGYRVVAARADRGRAHGPPTDRTHTPPGSRERGRDRRALDGAGVERAPCRGGVSRISRATYRRRHRSPLHVRPRERTLDRRI